MLRFLKGKGNGAGDDDAQKSVLGTVWDAVKKPFDKNEKELQKLQPLLEKVNALGPQLKASSDEELKAKSEDLKRRFRELVTQRLRERGSDWVELNSDPLGIDQEYERLRRAVEKGVLDELLPDAFALVRETSERTIGLRHYDVQIVGGAVLHSGRIAEMKTGEGKTLVASLPVYLNAISGRGVHVVTVNDYLAERDANWMRPIYEFLGLTVAFNNNNSTSEERKIAYQCDVLYATNSEVGFDYLRDNMALDPESLVQRPLNFGIVDEVDNILIDEARTPLIISAQVEQSERAQRKRRHAKVLDLVARKLVPATTDRDVEDLIARYKQGNDLDVNGLLDFILKRGCVQEAMQYLIESYVKPDSPARAENVAKLLALVNEINENQLTGPNAPQKLMELAAQTATSEQIAAAIRAEAARVIQPFGDALAVLLHQVQEQPDQESKIGATLAVLQGLLHLNPDQLEAVEDRLRTREDDHALRYDATKAALEEFARRKWIDEEEVAALAETLFEAEPPAAAQLFADRLVTTRGRLATALDLADELTEMEAEAPAHDAARRGVRVVELISSEGLLPHDASERLWELLRIREPHDELVRRITTAIANEPGANAQAIHTIVANFAKSRQQWLKERSDRLRNELGALPNLVKAVIDTLYQRARAGAAPEEMTRVLRQELYRFAPNSEVQKSVRKFAQDRVRAMEQLGAELLRELDELVELPKESRRLAQTILVGGGHAEAVRRDLHALVSDLPDESREAENVVAHTVNELIKWREENGDALVGALIALVALPAAAQTTIATAVHNGASPEVLEEIVADELLKLPANERIANCVASFAADWAAWREAQANATLDQLGARITLNDDLREVLREELSGPTNPPELPGQCLHVIARDVIGRHLEPLLTPESAEAFVEELKRRLPMEKKMPNRLHSADFAGKNGEQLMRAVLRLVEATLQTVVIEDLPRIVKPYGWFSEKDEKHHAAGMSDLGTLIAEREIGNPAFPDPEDFLNVLVENQVLREEEAAMVQQAMAAGNQQQVSVVVPQVIALEPARRRKLAELKMQEVQSVLDQAIKAHTLYQKDVHYVIEGGNEIVIVDEFTGRKMPGRRWSDGLHEAVEAKERVEVRLESQTVATVTIQNYFRLYDKLAGMTGTAKTEEGEFIKTYGLEVVSVPTNQPVRRSDYADIIFKTVEAKTRSTCFEILELYCKGQPVLVGTRSVEVSERLSERLKAQHLQTLCLTQLIKFQLWDAKKLDNKTKGGMVTALNAPLPQLNVAAVRGLAREREIAPDVTSGANLHQIKERLNLTDEHLPRLETALKGGIPHNVLNAKNHRNEARIVAEAARIGAVTIATNMAGRGVDILLGGTLDNEAKLRVITRQLVSRHLRGQFSRARSRNAETTDVLMRRLTPQALQQLVWVATIDERLLALQQSKQIDSALAKEIRDAYATDLTASDLRSRVRARARRLNVNALLPLDDESLSAERLRHAQNVFWTDSVAAADIQKTLDRGLLAHPYRIDARDTLLLRALFQLADREDERVYHLLHELTSLPDLDRALMETVALGGALDPTQLAGEMQRRNPRAQPVSVTWVQDRLDAFDVRDSAGAQRWLANAAPPEVELNDSQILQAVSSRLGAGEGADRAWLQQKLRGLNVVRSERRYTAGDEATFVHLRVEREALTRLASTINGSDPNGSSGGMGSRWRTSGDERLKLTDSEVSFDQVLSFIRERSAQAMWCTHEWLETRLLELAIVRDQQEVRIIPPQEGKVPTVLFRLRPQRLLQLLDQRLTDSLMKLARDSVTGEFDPDRVARDLLETLPEAQPWVEAAWVAERLHALGFGTLREGRFALKREAMPTVLIETGVAGQAADWVLPGEKRPEDLVQTSEYFEVKKLGGLHIIGTERHESRRIDNQLRGRAGRQGDPGSSRFYVSLEDELWRLFGVRGQALLNMWQEDEQVESKLISKQIENAQKKVEMNHFESRKHTLQYDDVMNVQREAIYKLRRKALLGVGLRESTVTMIDDVMKWNVTRYCPLQLQPEEWDLRRLHQAITKLFGSETVGDYFREGDLHDKPREELQSLLADALMKAYEAREQAIGPRHMRELERYQVCDTVDEYWMQHLAEMELLREGINLRAWGQREPLVEYRKEAYDMFRNMMANIQNDTLEFLMSVPVEAAVEWAGRRLRSRVSSMRYQWAETTTDAMGEVETYTHNTVKVGRNDPCPCGSGKKYKQCCLKKRREDV